MQIRSSIILFVTAGALISVPCVAQTPTLMLTTTGQRPVVGSYQSITSLVDGVNDKTVTWATSDPTNAPLVGNTTCPVGSVNCTIAVHSITAGTYTITATANADHTTTASATVTFIARPTPIACSSAAPDTAACHPKFFLTPSTLAAAQAKGVSSNPLYVGISNFAANYYTSLPTSYGFTWSTWNGTACTGGSGPTASMYQIYIAPPALHLAQAAMLDNSLANRNKYGCASRDVFMTAVNMFLTNVLPYGWNYPYGLENDLNGLTYTADALMSGGYLSPTDMQRVRVFLYGLAFDAGQGPGGGGTSMSSTGYNDPAIVINPTNENSVTGMRGIGNNYAMSWIQMMIIPALTLDDNTVDDPTIPTGQCMSAFVGNGGTGYATGDTVKLAGGNCVATVTAPAGVVTSLAITSPAGGYSGSTNPQSIGIWPAPSSTVTVTGSGSGLTANILVGNTCGAARGGMCADGTAANVHAYFQRAVGTSLYKWYASWEDPAVVQQAYNAAYSNMPTSPQCKALWTNNIGGTVPCLGMDRGGEPYEGHSYGNSIASLRDTLTAIDTAGYDDPITYGPQMSSDTGSIWDLRYIGDLNIQTGLSGVKNDARWNYFTDGDTNTAIGFSDAPYINATESAMLLADYINGVSYRSAGEQWLFMNAAFGRADGTATGPNGHACVTACGYMAEVGTDYASPTAVAAFLALPAGNPVTTNFPADPRPSMPLDWYNQGNQHVESRTSWTIGANTIFSAFCPNTQNDHEHQICGDYDIYSNGEYITKGRTELDNYDYGITSMSQENGQGLSQPPNQHVCPPSPFCTWWSGAAGGQMWHGYQSGLTPIQFSQMPNYVAITSDATHGYNGGWGGYNGLNGVKAASRQMIWLRGSGVVLTYDYGDTGVNNWAKTVSINTTGTPTISGNTATWHTQSGNQKAVWTNLLPASGSAFAINGMGMSYTITAPYTSLQVNTTMQAACTTTNGDGTTTDVTSNPNTFWYATGSATISSTGLITASASPGTSTIKCFYGSNWDASATLTVVSGASSTPTLSGTAANSQTPDWELANSVMVTYTAPNWQSLNALQWGSSSFTPITPTVVQSTSGQGFDGALVGTTLVMFARGWTASYSFTGFTYPASGATTQYVQGLTPNTSYSISGAGTPSSANTDNGGVLTFAAAGTGPITVGTVTPPPAAGASGFKGAGLSGAGIH